MPPLIVHTAGGRLTASNTPADVEAMLRTAYAEGHHGIVLHFHGGLVSERAGRDLADRLDPVYRAAGAIPVFSVWESQVWETILNNLPQVARESIFKLLLERVERILRRKVTQGLADRASGVLPPLADDHVAEEVEARLSAGSADQPMPETPLRGAEAITELSDAEARRLERELEMDAVLRAELNAISNGLVDPALAAEAAVSRRAGSRASTRTLMDPAALLRVVESRGPGDRGLIDALKFAKSVVVIAARVIHRFRTGRDHGVHATVVEEVLREFYVGNIGQWVWDQMKQDTEDAFRPGPEHGGTAILQGLGKLVAEGKHLKVTLVGHSTGAIYIAYLLQAAAEMGLDLQFDVIFLAPAVTCELWNENVLQGDASQRLRDFRTFGMSDALERDDNLIPFLPFVYPSSLLYMVSGLFERKADTPLVGMARYFDASRYPKGKFPHAEAVRNFATAPARGAIWSKATGVERRESEATTHGGFDEDGKTMHSVRRILETGF